MVEDQKTYEASLRNVVLEPRCVVVLKHILKQLRFTTSGDGSTPELRAVECGLRNEAFRLFRDIQKASPTVANRILVRMFENGRSN